VSASALMFLKGGEERPHLFKAFVCSETTYSALRGSDSFNVAS